MRPLLAAALATLWLLALPPARPTLAADLRASRAARAAGRLH